MHERNSFNMYQLRTLQRVVRGISHVAVSSMIVMLVYGDFSRSNILPHVPRAEAAPALKTVFITTTGNSTWTVPSDWNNASNTVHVIGGGGGGRTGGTSGSGGGGGGAYGSSTVSGLTVGASVTVRVGAGGAAGTAGGDTFFNRTAGTANTCADTVSVCAKGGSGATSATGAAGGAVASNKPANVGYSGGTGGTGNTTGDTGGGGAGAAGPNGAGKNGGAGQSSGAPGAGGGGGGANNGSVGSAGSGNGGAGGNNRSGSGGGAGANNATGVAAQAGSSSGGGGGGAATTTTSYRAGAAGGTGETIWTATVGGATAGPGGGGGGAGATTANGTGSTGGNGGGYGGGGGGAYTTAGTGAQGIIVIQYVPLPVPNPPFFTSLPSPLSDTSIGMTSTTTDGATTTSYYFTATTTTCGTDLGTGYTDSGWQSSTSYTDTGLQPNKCYAYTITSKDANGYFGATSSASSTYTLAATPTAPTLATVTGTTLVLTNNENGNPTANPSTSFTIYVSGTSPNDSTWEGKYVTSAGAPSATPQWLSDAQLTNLTVTGLTGQTSYSFYSVARNQNSVNAATSSAAATTTAYTAPTITVSGTLFSDEGVTQYTTAGKTITLKVDGAGSYSTTTVASGAWRINGVTVSTSSVITVWFDNDATLRGTTVTVASSSVNNITGLDLYRNRVIVRNESTTGSTTITHLAVYDSSDDSNIPFTAATGTTPTLSVGAGNTLYVWPATIFNPGGSVTVQGNASSSPLDGTLRLATNSTYLAGGNTTLAGSFMASSGASFIPGTHTLTLNGTTTGKQIAYATTSGMGNVSIDGVGGGYMFAQNATTTGLTVKTGATLVAPQDLTVRGSFANAGTYTHNSGTLTMDAITAEVAAYLAGRDASGDSGGMGSVFILTLAVSGNYLYAGKDADATACSQTPGSADGCELMVFDISSTTNPVYVAGRDANGDSGGTGSAPILTLAVSGNYLYAGKDAGATACSQTPGSADGCELMVFDISSTTNPVYVAGRDARGDSTGTGWGGINTLAVSGNYLYAGKSGDATACSQTPGSAIGCELMVFDISSTTNPVYVAGRDASGNSGGTGSALIRTLAVSGNYLYAGNSAAATACSQTPGSADGCELMVFDISSTTNPVYVAGRDANGNSGGTGSAYISTLAVSGNYLYAGKVGDATACSQTPGSAIGCELMVFDISSTTNPVYLAGRDASGNSGGTGSADISTLAVSGNYLYAGKWGDTTACSQTAGSADGCELMVFDGAPPAGLLTGTLIGTSPLNHMHASGTVRFASNASTTNLTVRSGATLTAPGLLTVAGSYTQNGTFMAVPDSTVYMASTSPQTLSGTMTGTSSFGKLIFSGSGVKTFAANASTTNLTIDTGATLVAPPALTIAGNYANSGTFTHNDGLADIKAYITNYLAGRDASGNSGGTGSAYINTLAVSGNYLYAGKGGDATACSQTAGSALGCELMVFDVSSTTNPVYVAGRDASGNSGGTGSVWINTLAVSGNYLYAGKWGDTTACSQTPGSALGCELMVFDVSSTTNPVYVAGRDASGNSGGTGSAYIRTLAVSGNYLYAGKQNNATACSQTAGSADGCEIMVFDISSTTNPVYVAGRDASGDSTGTGEGYIYTLAVSGNYLYAGKSGDATACSQTPGSAIGCEIMVFDISSTTNPVYVAGRDASGNSGGTGWEVINTLAVSGNYLYAGKGGDATACSQTAGSANGCELMQFGAPTLSGTMTGTSAWNNLAITGNGAHMLTNASTTNLTISSGATLVAPSQLSLGSTLTNSGTFTHASGTVYLTGTTNTLTGTTTFYNLTKIATTTSTTTFGAGSTYTIQGTWTAQGVSNTQPQNLRSSVDGQYWYIHAPTRSLQYLNVKDSYATSTVILCNAAWCTATSTVNWLVSYLASLQGTLYTDEGTTQSTQAGKTLTLATQGYTFATTTVAGTGAWRFDEAPVATGTALVLYINNDATFRAVTVTVASSSVNNITGLNLYKDRVIVRNESTTGSTTITHLAAYDSSDDSDIQFTAATGTTPTLSVGAGNTLYVWPATVFNPGGSVTVHGNASSSPVDGTLRLATNSTYLAGGPTTLAGSFMASSGASYIPGTYTLILNATTTGKSITYATTSSMGAVVFNGIGGAWSFATDATTTGLTIATGTVSAPANLTLDTYNNAGTFTHNNGTLYAHGTSSRLVGGDAVNSSWADATYEYVWSLTSHNGTLYAGVSGNSAGEAEVWAYNGATWSKIGGDAVNSSWADATYELVYSLTSHNGTLYAGVSGFSAGEAEVWAYNGATWSKVGGDAVNSSWADATYEYVYSLTSHNGTLYAGLGSGTGDAEVWAYNGATWSKVGGDAVNSSWGAGYEIVYSLTSHNGTLYAGLGASTGDAEVWAYNGATWSKVGGDAVNSSWADATYEMVYSLTSHNGTLYAGLGYSTGDAEVWAYNGATWSKVGGDAVNSSWADATYERVFSLTSHNGTLYAGVSGTSAGEAEVWAYNGATWSKVGGDAVNSSWADATYEYVSSLTSHNGTLYAGLGASTGDAEVWAYNGATWSKVGGDAVNSTWADATYEYVYSLTSHNGTLYAGLGLSTGEAEVWAFPPAELAGTMTGASAWNDVVVLGGHTLTSAASTTNLTLTTGAYLFAGSATTSTTSLSVGSSFTNAGTFTPNQGTVYLTTNPTHTVTGTTTFYNLTKVATTTSTTTFGAGSTYTIQGTWTFDGVSPDEPHYLRSSANGAYWYVNPQGTRSVNNVDVQDSYNTNATAVYCATPYSCTDAGHNENWQFVFFASDRNQSFEVGQATTTLARITFMEGLATSTVTAANDMRITIATTTTNFRFDPNGTLSFGGTAASKVSTSYTLADNGATLVLDVTSDFAAGDTLTIDGIPAGSFATKSATTSRLALHLDGDSSGTPAAYDLQTLFIGGAITMSDHTVGQIPNQFIFGNTANVPLFGLRFSPSEQATVTALTLSLSAAHNIGTGQVTNIRLVRDNDHDATFSAGDTTLGTGTLTTYGFNGSMSFTDDFLATTTNDFLVVADLTGVTYANMMTIALPVANVSATALADSLPMGVNGSVTPAEHFRGRAKITGGSPNAGGPIGGDGPSGIVRSGGSSHAGTSIEPADPGDTIGNEVGFYIPTITGAQYNEWTNGTNALTSDGSYASAASEGLRQTYTGFNFNIPSGNTITGIAVKLEASGSTAAGTIDIVLSWDNGTTTTSAKTTPTLTASDGVYTIGGDGDTWGQSWTALHFSNDNFHVRVIAHPNSNTVRIDALQVSPYHQATGGSSGGGGAI